MKKILLLATCTFVISASQVSFAKEKISDYKISLFAGLGFNSMKNVATKDGNYNLDKGKNRTGFLFGINGEKKLTDRYSLNLGLGVDWRGGGLTATAVDTSLIPSSSVRSTSAMYKTQYFTVPVSIKMLATEVEKFKIFALAGAELGIVISQKGESATILKDGTSATDNGGKLKGYATANPVNVSWTIGAGTEYPVSKENNAYFILQYRNGLIDATLPRLNKTGLVFTDGNVRSNSFTLRVGYTF
jgi:opacity protein-like surface antigen